MRKILKLKATDYPILSDLYELLNKEFKEYNSEKTKQIYTEETLQSLCLGLDSMCVGTESKYFNGHTNIADDDFLCLDSQRKISFRQRTSSTPLR